MSRGRIHSRASLFRAEILGTNKARLCFLVSPSSTDTMVQSSPKTTRPCDVREPPIPHRTRLVHGRGTSVTPRHSRIQAPGQARCRNRHVALPGAHIRERYGETEVPGSCTWPCASFSCLLSDFPFADRNLSVTWQVDIGKKLDPVAFGQFWSDGGRCGWVRDLLG